MQKEIKNLKDLKKHIVANNMKKENLMIDKIITMEAFLRRTYGALDDVTSAKKSMTQSLLENWDKFEAKNERQQELLKLGRVLIADFISNI